MREKEIKTNQKNTTLVEKSGPDVKKLFFFVPDARGQYVGVFFSAETFRQVL